MFDKQMPPPSSKPRKKGKGELVIERALKRSLFILAILLMAVGTISLLLNMPGNKPGEQRTLITPPSSPNLPEQMLPSIPFTNYTEASGVDFTHFNASEGEKLLPETMGSGVAIFDSDADGDQDLLFVNGTPWPWTTNSTRPSSPAPTPKLYQNDGKGLFTDATIGSGLDISHQGMGVAIGDYNNDGRSDIFLTGLGGGRLFENLGNNRFEEQKRWSNVAQIDSDWSTSAAWMDINNDGLLDLFVCNYVTWTRAIDFEVDYRLVGIGRAYGPPMNFAGSFPRLYVNKGYGRFEEAAKQSGLHIVNRATGLPMAKSLGVSPVDLNSDGWIDIIVANDTVQNFVFLNQKNGTFKETGASTGIAFDSYGSARGAMGIDTARFQNDSTLGVLIGNFANEMAAFYVSQNDSLTFADEAISQGVGPASRLALTFGVFFFDADLDGWLDLLTANGHIEEEIDKIQKSQTYKQPPTLYWNLRGSNPKGGFARLPPTQTGHAFNHPLVARGAAYGDFDSDGDLDVVLTQNGNKAVLLRNELPTVQNWFRLKLVGTKSNRDAIGAWVRVSVSGQVLWRFVNPAKGYLSCSELPVTVGFPPDGKLQEIQIIWPSGQSQKVPLPTPKSTTVIREATL